MTRVRNLKASRAEKTGEDPPLVVVEELHAKDGHDPADDLDDDDADDNGHAAPVDGRQHLTADDGVDSTVPKLSERLAVPQDETCLFPECTRTMRMMFKNVGILAGQ